MIEKGGKFRNAPCLQSMKATIERDFPNVKERNLFTKEEFKESYEKLGNNLFDRYISKIDNHAFRHEYARNLYNQIVSNRLIGLLINERILMSHFKGKYSKTIIGISVGLFAFLCF